MCVGAHGQSTGKDEPDHPGRKGMAAAALISASSLSYVGLNSLWYKEFPRSSFHLFNDGPEWKQMDKVGHAMTSYWLGTVGSEIADWAGLNDHARRWWGGGMGFLYLTGIECLDGFSSGWGFSIRDELANAGGSLLFIGQDALWNEQKIKLKFSYSGSKYANCRPEVLGENTMQRVLKDYNGQTYWMSMNIYSFMNDDSKFPKWINAAIGMGADGMLGGRGNAETLVCDVDAIRSRSFYLSLDVDLSRIKTKNRFLCVTKSVFGFIKFPFPTVEYSVEKGWLGHWIYF